MSLNVYQLTLLHTNICWLKMFIMFASLQKTYTGVRDRDIFLAINFSWEEFFKIRVLSNFIKN